MSKFLNALKNDINLNLKVNYNIDYDDLKY
jgi:hypothetical protein